MADIYEVEYKYLDELEDKNSRWHEALACIYDSTKVGAGETIQYALDKAREDGDYSGVDKLLTKLYGLTDEDICFYYDVSELDDRGLVFVAIGLQRNFDIILNEIKERK